MGKEYTLPWNCETSNKLKPIISSILMICGLVSLVMFFSSGNGHVPDVTVPNVFLFLFGILGFAIGAADILFLITMNDMWPSFKCKSKVNQNSE